MYLGTVLSGHGEMEGEISERVVKGGSVIGALARVMIGRNVYTEVKRGLRNSILLAKLRCGPEDMVEGIAVKSACCRNEQP